VTMTMPLDVLRDLYRHMEWADAAVWRAALAHPPAARDARLRNLILHLHTVQRAFLLVWTQEELTFPDDGQFPDIGSIREWTYPVYARATRFLDSVTAAALERPVVMPWAAQLATRLGRTPDDPTLAETIFQVTSHSTYHRGQVNARLRELGAEPPLVDFIAWVWFGRPEPDWQAT
jgi:uncharacterized damage-inducible protein DinB